MILTERTLDDFGDCGSPGCLGVIEQLLAREAELRTVVAAAERVLAGAKTGLDNEAVIALYEAVKSYREPA